MTKPFPVLAALAALILSPVPAGASDLPPGLVAAELMPGHVTAEGTRMTALRLELEPGWKTYWRSPGDTGVPPRLDWTGSVNLARATPLWPRPEVIESGGERTLGYHDRLVLPIELVPAVPGQPVTGGAAVDFGLCREVCVSAHVDLILPDPAPPGAAPDPAIAAALAAVPDRGDAPVTCAVTAIADGIRVAAGVEAPGRTAETAALELAQDGVWVSRPDLTRDGDRITATADFVAPSGKPFPLDPAALRLTLIGADGAVEYQGCAPA